MVGLVRRNNLQVHIGIVLQPHLLKCIFVEVVARVDMDLCHKLFVGVVDKNRL